MLQILGKVSEYFYPHKRFARFFVFLRENSSVVWRNAKHSTKLKAIVCTMPI